MSWRRARRWRVITLVHALLLLAGAVVSISGAESGASVLVLHRIRLPLLSAVRRRWRVISVGVVLLVVAVLPIGHPPGAVHGLDAALSATARVYATV